MPGFVAIADNIQPQFHNQLITSFRRDILSWLPEQRSLGRIHSLAGSKHYLIILLYNS